ncbi:MAG: OmpA family protein [Flavobacteriales bacterium]|nr:OmpA family protein [Flavobacteriales bacterium]
MKKHSLGTLMLFVSISLFAQEVPDSINMVTNGSFEEFEGRLKRLGSIKMATGWDSPTEVPADLFSGTISGSDASAPRNELGEQGALTGENYAGILHWSYMGRQPRSYIQTKFKKMLTKGQKYCVRYYTSLADMSKYASSEHGVYISRMMVRKNDESSLTYDVQVPTLRTKIYDDPYSWQGVCGVYEAKGDEQYLVIGNMAANEATNTEKIKRPKGLSGAQLMHAYYYIDDVAVFPIRLMSECTCKQLDEAESEFIYSRKGRLNPSLPPGEQVDQMVFYFKRFQRGIDQAMDATLTALVTLLKENEEIKVRLVGHTDVIEADRVRMRPDLTELARERAMSLKDALMEEGIAGDRITTAGVGAESPADPEESEVALSKNRRVEIELE